MSHHPAFRSWPILLAYWLLIKPLAICFLVCTPLKLLRPEWFSNPKAYVGIFVAVTLAINSRFGSRLVETLALGLIDQVRKSRFDMFRGLFRFILWFFRRLTSMFEVALHGVEEWLVLSERDGMLVKILCGILGACWIPISFVIRLVFLVIVEPNLNPVKFLISVMVAKGLILFTPTLEKQIEPNVSRMLSMAALTEGSQKAEAAVAFALASFFCGFVLPGAITFLIWEIRENWRLYRANRPKKLQPTIIGDHGETVLRLLKPGLHSGTLPKQFALLRRAEKIAYHTSDWRSVRSIRENLRHVASAVDRFVERDLVPYLQRDGVCEGVFAGVGPIHLASNSMLIELVHCSPDVEPMKFSIELLDEMLIATIQDQGWVGTVAPAERQKVCFALAGLFKLAGVQRISKSVGKRPIETSLGCVDSNGQAHTETPSSSSQEHDERQGRLKGVAMPEFIDFSQVRLTWDDWTNYWMSKPDDKSNPAVSHARQIEMLLLDS